MNKSRFCNMLVANESHEMPAGYRQLIHKMLCTSNLCDIFVDVSARMIQVKASSLRERERGPQWREPLVMARAIEENRSEIIPGNRRTVGCSWRARLPGDTASYSGCGPGQKAHPFRRLAVARSRSLRIRNAAAGSDQKPLAG